MTTQATVRLLEWCSHAIMADQIEIVKMVEQAIKDGIEIDKDIVEKFISRFNSK